MKNTQFDAKTRKMFTTEVEHNGTPQAPYGYHITGDGYYVIVNPNSKYVSFSKMNRDVCFGDIVSDIIKEYTNQQYADDYGNKVTGIGKTVRQYMIENCRMDIIDTAAIAEAEAESAFFKSHPELNP